MNNKKGGKQEGEIILPQRYNFTFHKQQDQKDLNGKQLAIPPNWLMVWFTSGGIWVCQPLNLAYINSLKGKRVYDFWNKRFLSTGDIELMLNKVVNYKIEVVKNG